jgi:hypothetical protein
MEDSVMRGIIIALTFVLIVSMGCGTTAVEGGGSDRSNGTTTVDGLVKVEIEGPGQLFLRKDHGIGGYDAIAIAPSFLNYRRTSARLDPDDEEVYKVSLEQAVLDVAEAAHVPVSNELGPCTIKIGAGFVNVDIARSASAKVLGRMTLVIEYQDSVSGQSLLRFASDQQIERESEGTSREKQIADSFDRMIEEVDMITALRKATAVPSPPRPGCDGALINAGRPPA